ncbi:hypothetical protein G9C98_000567 [Cotesia typhae]|uniref:Uncharacterized protein n=1 Tax=Cotesia typhae TaxID=2053667 RepID=A0A8J5QSG2_9HYME|nr:hypothetical protein G9C98_000567 [Cotesia typhae]
MYKIYVLENNKIHQLCSGDCCGDPLKFARHRYEAAKRRAQSTKYPSRFFLPPADMLARPTAVPCTEQTPHCQSGSWKLRKTAFWS